MAYFAVVREIEAKDMDCQVFDRESDARSYYEDTAYIAMNGPDDAEDGDPIVTNCWLYHCNETDRHAAEVAALEERATLLAVCFSPEEM
jgi:hypothetical protein